MDKLLSIIVYKTPRNPRTEEIGELLSRKRTAIRRHETLRRRLLRWSIAGCLAVIALCGGIMRLSQVELESGDRELPCTLPDGSQVKLMPGSRLSYNKFTWVFRRRAVLSGLAVFAVTHGKAFSVATAAGKVAVLGTRFLVRQNGGDLEVECYEGSVRVEVPSGALVLQAGKRVRSDSGGITLSDIAPPLPMLIPFEAVPLREVIDNIETIFGVCVTGKERYADLVFTGFIITSDIHQTLEAVFRPCGIGYEISGNEIILE